MAMPSSFLVFTLAGPMAAWGDVAVGESRPTFSRPSKSAVLGLVGAALGLGRDDAAAHAALRRGYGFAVWPAAPGHLLLDYHTAQVPTGKGNRGLPTRRHELAQPSLITTLSTRAYRTDAHAVVALWSRLDARWTLGALRDALRTPVYPLFLGRRACPPSLPLGPYVVRADSVLDAFLAYQADGDTQSAWTLPAVCRDVYADLDAPGLTPDGDVHTRRDDPVHRGQRTFADRREIRAHLPES